MLKRIITAVVAICVLVPILIFSDTVLFPAALAAIAVICIFELLRCMGLHKKPVVCIPLYIAAVSVPFALRYTEEKLAFAVGCYVAAAVYLMLIFFSVIRSHGKLTFADGMAVFAICLYVIAAINSILYVRDFGDGGKYVYLLIFIGAWITDTFAYFTGVFFGKHKLIEDVSPKKTVEGSLGGILFCVIFFVIFGVVVDVFFERDANIAVLAVSGAVVSVISQIGDLIMSVIKRHYGIKDYGRIFPGHGGMLDRFDSVLAVSLGMGAICMLTGILGISLL